MGDVRAGEHEHALPAVPRAQDVHQLEREDAILVQVVGANHDEELAILWEARRSQRQDPRPHWIHADPGDGDARPGGELLGQQFPPRMVGEAQDAIGGSEREPRRAPVAAPVLR